MRAALCTAALVLAACSQDGAPPVVPARSSAVQRSEPAEPLQHEAPAAAVPVPPTQDDVDEPPPAKQPPFARMREEARATPPDDDGRRFYFEGRVVSDLDEPVTVRIGYVTEWCSGEPVRKFETTVAPGASFRIEGLPRHLYSGNARSPSSAVAHIPQFVVTEDVRGVEIHVRKACRVSGHVTLGAGIDRANCRVNWSRGDDTTDIGQLRDDDRFTLERLEPGPVRLQIAHFPERSGPQASLRGYAAVESTLVPGDNAVEIVVDAKTIRPE